MASLRDVLNHIGRPATLERDGRAVGQVLLIRRDLTAFVEAKFEPHAGDVVHLTDAERFRIDAVEAETIREKVDHYKLRLLPL